MDVVVNVSELCSSVRKKLCTHLMILQIAVAIGHPMDDLSLKQIFQNLNINIQYYCL